MTARAVQTADFLDGTPPCLETCISKRTESASELRSIKSFH